MGQRHVRGIATLGCTLVMAVGVADTTTGAYTASHTLVQQTLTFHFVVRQLKLSASATLAM